MLLEIAGDGLELVAIARDETDGQALMTDAYPPFRLDMGGHESAPDSAAADAVTPSPAPGLS